MKKFWFTRAVDGYVVGEGDKEITHSLPLQTAALFAAAPELLSCVLDVLDADGDLDAMDFDRYRAAIERARA